MITVQIIFALSILLILYSYVGYPAILRLLSFFQKRRSINKEFMGYSSVSLLISAYNEEDVIKEKIQNSLALDYPREQLEIVVISDGSTDETDNIVRGFKDSEVILLRFEGRIGKTACLNKAIPLVKGDVLVFSDANSLYPPHGLRALVTPFLDESIGFVTGGTKYVSEMGSKLGESMSIYVRLERYTKALENNFGSCVGADGAMFAIRRSLYQPLDESDLNDLVIPLKIIQSGYRGIFAPNAYCTERVGKEQNREFGRQVRIGARTIRAVLNHRGLLNPIKFGFFSLQLFSHKVCKLIVPFALLVMFISNILLTWAYAYYGVLLVWQLLLYTTCWIKLRSTKGAVPSLARRLVDLSHSFIMVNAAVGVAWLRFLKGERFTTWASTR